MSRFTQPIIAAITEIDAVAPLINTGTSSAAVLELNPAFGGFYDTAIQQLLSITAEQEVAIGQTASSNNVTRINTGEIRFDVAGTYTFTYSVLFTNPTAQNEYVNLYVKFNNTVVPGTNTAIVVPSKHGIVNGTLKGTNTFIIPAAVNDNVSLWWSGTSLDLKIVSTPAIGTTPSSNGVLFSTHQIGSA